MYEYYHLACAGAFCARDIKVWQILMSKGGFDLPLFRLGMGQADLRRKEATVVAD